MSTIRHKNILPLRLFEKLLPRFNQIYFDLFLKEGARTEFASYKIKFDGTNLSKIEEDEEEK